MECGWEDTERKSPRRLVSVQRREDKYLNQNNGCLDMCKSILTFFLSFFIHGNEALEELNDKMAWLYGRGNGSSN